MKRIVKILTLSLIAIIVGACGKSLTSNGSGGTPALTNAVAATSSSGGTVTFNGIEIPAYLSSFVTNPSATDIGRVYNQWIGFGDRCPSDEKGAVMKIKNTGTSPRLVYIAFSGIKFDPGANGACGQSWQSLWGGAYLDGRRAFPSPALGGATLLQQSVYYVPVNAEMTFTIPTNAGGGGRGAVGIDARTVSASAVWTDTQALKIQFDVTTCNDSYAVTTNTPLQCQTVHYDTQI